ncbi:MAG: GSCFA domain-containing protein [Bacteroidota bacterium]
MNFKLDFDPAAPPKLLNYRQPMLLTGSCFSEHIAGLLRESGFKIMSQPNGVVFNPVSIAGHLTRILANEPYMESELSFYNELWHSWAHHGSFNATDKNLVLNAVNAAFEQARALLQEQDAVIGITLGSAWVYERTEAQGMVANCHKYPAAHFTKRLLGVEEVVNAFEKMLELRPGRPIYFTVSPVRHVRDGLVENNVSKGILLQAVYQLCKKYNTCYYFPAYEMVIDELRDHRFYNADLIHPNQQAIEYVWQRFVETCMDEETRLFVKEMRGLNAMMQHKILHEGTAAHRKFEEAKSVKQRELEEKYGRGS